MKHYYKILSVNGQAILLEVLYQLTSSDEIIIVGWLDPNGEKPQLDRFDIDDIRSSIQQFEDTRPLLIMQQQERAISFYQEKNKIRNESTRLKKPTQ